MFIAALFTIAEIQKQRKCSSTYEWIMIYGYILMGTHTHTHTHTHTKGYYSTIIKNKNLPFLITCMDLEGIMLSEISQRNTNTV